MQTGTMAVEVANSTDRTQQGIAVGKVMAAVVDVVITMSESMDTSDGGGEGGGGGGPLDELVQIVQGVIKTMTEIATDERILQVLVPVHKALTKECSTCLTSFDQDDPGMGDVRN